jgi:tripartite-type tricarboxylate transporter receptor subunit TctC
MIRRRILLTLGLFLAAPLPAGAQAFPARPVNMVIPFPPGGNTDIMGRALQNELGKALGQTVVIINKGGAAGTIGMNEVVKAQADGYTVALTPNNPLTAQPHLQKLSYGMDSFRFVCLTYYAPYVLIAGPQAPFKTFDEFVRFAKAKSENLVYGHPGVASQPHLGMLEVLRAIGADGLGVPFQGAGPMSHALLGGTIMAITETPCASSAIRRNRSPPAGSWRRRARRIMR